MCKHQFSFLKKRDNSYIYSLIAKIQIALNFSRIRTQIIYQEITSFYTYKHEITKKILG
jgi:hypothetical protein